MKKIILGFLLIGFMSNSLAQENPRELNLVLQASALWLLSLAKSQTRDFFEKEYSMRSRNDYYNLLASSGLYCSCLGLCFATPCTECFMCAGCVCASAALIIKQPERTDFYHAHE